MIDVSRLSYKPGWRFKIAGPLNRYLCVYATTPDSLNPDQNRTTQHQFKMPDGGFADDRELARWVLNSLFLAERHETCEFFTLDGVAVFWPHHQDEGDPYEIVERLEPQP